MVGIGMNEEWKGRGASARGRSGGVDRAKKGSNASRLPL
jgi:hypothetical protein